MKVTRRELQSFGDLTAAGGPILKLIPVAVGRSPQFSLGVALRLHCVCLPQYSFCSLALIFFFKDFYLLYVESYLPIFNSHNFLSLNPFHLFKNFMSVSNVFFLLPSISLKLSPVLIHTSVFPTQPFLRKVLFLSFLFLF